MVFVMCDGARAALSLWLIDIFTQKAFGGFPMYISYSCGLNLPRQNALFLKAPVSGFYCFQQFKGNARTSTWISNFAF